MRLIVLGGSSLGKSVISIARAQGNLDVIGVVDDLVQVGSLIEGVPCLGSIDDLESVLGNSNEIEIVIAIGDTRIRYDIHRRIRHKFSNIKFKSIIHPMATLLGHVQLGLGCIVFPGCVLGPDVVIGTACLLNANVSVGAGTCIADFVTLCPGVNIGSEATLGTGTYVGMGAAIAQQVHLGPWSTLGALSFARENVATEATAVGTPARERGF